jgi:DNA-binding response OmpR family regulator
MARVLIVEDDFATRKLVRFALEQMQGHDVLEAGTVAEAEDVLRTDSPDLVISDVVMPGPNGFEFCRRLRAQQNIPFLFVSALADVDSKVQGLKLGADDYLAKPFEPAELLARVEALLRRSARTVRTDSEGLIKVGDITINLTEHRAEIRPQRGLPHRAELSPTEFKLLLVLVRSPGKALSHAELAKALWPLGGGVAFSTSTLKAHVSRLRDHLEPDPAHPRYIRTVRGAGYRLDAHPD